MYKRQYENCTEDDWFLRNVDDATVMQYAQHIPCKVIDFSLTRQDVDLYRKDGTVYLHELALFEEKNFHVVGDYNLSNAMIASCMAYKLGVSVSDIRKAIAAFSPVEHRLDVYKRQVYPVFIIQSQDILCIEIDNL